MIIIISLEGKDSNTEVNFFEGLNYHLNNEECRLKIYPFEKAKKSNKRKKEIIGEVKHLLKENFENLENLEEVKLFFIGDGDSSDQLKAMENTKNIIVNYFKERSKEFKNINYNDEILLKREFGFEELYLEMLLEKDFPSNSKKSSNKSLFNNFAQKACWIKNGEIDFLKIKKDMDKTKNPHIKIIEAVCSCENRK